MSSMDRKENYQLFCQKAKVYGVCDEMSGNDNHKRVRMGRNGNSKARFEAQLRKDYMIVLYDKIDIIGNAILRTDQTNLPATRFNTNYDYYSIVYPEDYDNFLQLVSLKLGRKQYNNLQDINIPMKPKKIIRKADGTSSYQCARCDYFFRQSDRCPECGQLVKE